MKTFSMPGIIKQFGRRKPLEVSIFLEAETREDARFQAHHGVVEATVEASYPKSSVQYDVRKLRVVRG